MKPIPTILLMVVVVVVGILVYDTLRGDEVGPPAGDETLLEAEASDPRLGNTLAARLEPRLARLEEQVEAQGRELAVLLEDGLPASGAAHPGPGRGVGGRAPTLVTYDEETLASLQVHLQELTRRQREDAQRNSMTAGLNRLSLSLDESQRNQLVTEALRYHADAAAGWSELRARGVTDGAEIQAELSKLRASFVERIRPLVASSDLERVTDALIGRAGSGPPVKPAGGSSAPGR